MLGLGVGKFVTAVISGSLTLEEGLKHAYSYQPEPIADLETRAEMLVERETRDGAAVFVEIGPAGALMQILVHKLEQNHRNYRVFDLSEKSVKYGAIPGIIDFLYTSGLQLNWDTYGKYSFARRIELPPYQFQKIRCWLREQPKEQYDDPKVQMLAQAAASSQAAVSIPVLQKGSYIHQRISGIWSELVNGQSISDSDNFFDIGGDSLTATRMIIELNREFDLKLSFEDVFDFPTISLLGSYIESILSLEQKVMSVWKEVLKTDKIRREDNFFELGGHSLMANQILLRLRKLFEIDLNFEDIFEYPVVSQLSGYIGQRMASDQKDGLKDIAVAPEADSYSLSFAQKRIWILSQFTEGSLAYNTTGAYLLEGVVQPEAFGKALDALVNRHDSLRTVFAMIDGEPRQLIRSAGELNLP